MRHVFMYWGGYLLQFQTPILSLMAHGLFCEGPGPFQRLAAAICSQKLKWGGKNKEKGKIRGSIFTQMCLAN